MVPSGEYTLHKHTVHTEFARSNRIYANEAEIRYWPKGFVHSQPLIWVMYESEILIKLPILSIGYVITTKKKKLE